MIHSILARLEKTRKTGKDSFIACCPAHKDNTPSLALRTVEDGRILIHCFAGCEPLDILKAIDLDMNALFPDKGIGGSKLKNPFASDQALKCLAFEATVISLCGSDMLANKFNENDRERLMLAVSRIHSAINLVGI